MPKWCPIICTIFFEISCDICCDVNHNINFIEINSLCEIMFVWWVMINHISSGNKMWQKSFLFLFQTQNSKKVLWNLEMYTHKKTLVLYSNWFFVLERNSIFKLEIFYDRRWSLFLQRNSSSIEMGFMIQAITYISMKRIKIIPRI